MTHVERSRLLARVRSPSLLALYDLFGFGGLAELHGAQRGWVDESPRSEVHAQAREWATAIAVGSRAFVEKVKVDLGIGARHQDIDVSGTTGVLREPEAACNHEMTIGNSRIGDENKRFRNDA